MRSDQAAHGHAHSTHAPASDGGDTSESAGHHQHVQFHAKGAIPAPGKHFESHHGKSATDHAFKGPGGEYTVVRGDTLWAIAKKNHVSLNALIAANPQIKNPSLIRPGQVVHLPRAAKGTTPPMVVGEEIISGGDVEAQPATEEPAVDEAPPEPHKGDHGPEVAELQQLLKAAGYYHGGVGGNFGTQTDAALRHFQRDHGLAEDGHGTPQTLEALRAAVPATTAAEPEAAAPAESSGGGSAVSYGTSVLGAPYAAINPYRFGDVPWPGGAKVDIHGKLRGPFEAGTQVFDCSGFVVACWRRAGVDLLAHGLGDSRSVVSHKGWLQPVTPEQLQPGDLIAYPGHIVMYFGGGQVIQSTPNGGVKISDAGKYLGESGVVCRRVPV